MEETNIPLVTSITPSNAYFDDMNAIHDVKSFVKKFHYESKKLWYLAGPAIFTYVPLPILIRCCYSNLCWSCWNHLTYCCFDPNPCNFWIFRGNTVGNGKRIGMVCSLFKNLWGFVRLSLASRVMIWYVLFAMTIERYGTNFVKFIKLSICSAPLV